MGLIRKLIKWLSNFVKSIWLGLKTTYKLIKRPGYDKMIKSAIEWEWFDYGYMFDIEKAELETMIQHYESKDALSAEAENVAKQMKLCLKLLNIVIDDGLSLWHFNKNRKIQTDIYVNTRNMHRFVDKKYENHYLAWPADLYVMKALYLYHAIRARFDKTWWD